MNFKTFLYYFRTVFSGQIIFIFIGSDMQTKTKDIHHATAAIKQVIACCFPSDAPYVDDAVLVGDPHEWGSEVATIYLENEMECLDMSSGRDWIGEGHQIEAHVLQETGLRIFIEHYNAAVVCVYWL